MKKPVVSIIAIAALFAVGPASSQSTGEAKDDTSEVEIPRQVRQQIQRNGDQYLERTIARLYQLNASGTVTPADLERNERVDKAKHRARALTDILAHDIDGDGNVTRAELADAMSSQQANQRARNEVKMLKQDANGDGILQFEESVAAIDANMTKDHRLNRRRQANLLMFDENRDGSITIAEVSSTIERVKSEPLPVATPRHPRARPSVEKCDLKAPSAEAEIIAVSGYEGLGVSTVAVSGQGRETSVATLKIEPGTKPLYIFATTYDAIVWKLEGATERVEHMAVQPTFAKHGPGVGVVGLDKSKVGFSEAGSCGKYVTKPDNAKTMLLKAKLTSALGRDVDKMITSYNLFDVRVPSGKMPDRKQMRRSKGMTVVTKEGTYILNGGIPELVKPADASRLESELNRFYPAGVIKLDVKDVVASGPVEAYDVLPQQAGLMQLVESGHLRRSEDGYFIIEKTFSRFPAGLNGGHSVKFLLKKGVELPEGSAGHSSIYDEATGNCLSGARCR